MLRFQLEYTHCHRGSSFCLLGLVSCLVRFHYLNLRTLHHILVLEEICVSAAPASVELKSIKRQLIPHWWTQDKIRIRNLSLLSKARLANKSHKVLINWLFGPWCPTKCKLLKTSRDNFLFQINPIQERRGQSNEIIQARIGTLNTMAMKPETKILRSTHPIFSSEVQTVALIQYFITPLVKSTGLSFPA